VRVVFATAVVMLAAPTAASAYANFRAPGRTLYCELGDLPAPRVLICWRARDGLSIGMLPTGRATVSPDRNNKANHQDRAPVLGYNHTWRYRTSYRCISKPAGVTCRNRSNHGFFLGRFRGFRLL
jgi:hypothetical protein